MKNITRVFILFFCIGLLNLYATAMGTAFTYQGYLQESSKAAEGSYDMTFKLYDSNVSTTQVGSTITKNSIDVEKGIFSQELDFGNIFDGTQLWLEVAVRHIGVGNYETLSPRQKLTATPYAEYALNVASVSGSDFWGSSWSGSGNGLILQSVDETAVEGINTDTDNSGKLGTANYAVYGHSDSQYAGYFDGKTVIKGNLDINNSWVNVERGNNENGGIAYKEIGSSGTQWIFPYFRGWQSNDLIVRDEAAVPKRDVMTFKSTTGRVGVNTRTPSALFEVNGDVKITQDLNLSSWININRPDSNLSGVTYKRESDSATQWIFPYYGAWRYYTGAIGGGLFVQTENMIVYDDTIDRDVMTFQKGTGRVAINQNAANPDAELDVNGDVHVRGNLVVDGNITHSEKIGAISISAAAFSCVIYEDKCDKGGGNFAGDSGFIYKDGPLDGTFYVAPINLPDGVRVTQFEVYFVNERDDTNAVSLSLKRKHNPDQALVYMASVSANAKGGYHYKIDDTIDGAVIDNVHYTYWLSGYIKKTSVVEKVEVRSARILYTYHSTDK